MDFLFADSTQQKLIDRFLEDGKARGFECESDEYAPTLVKDGKIVDFQYAQAVREGRHASSCLPGAMFLKRCMTASLVSKQMVIDAARGVRIPIHPSWILVAAQVWSEEGLWADVRGVDVYEFSKRQMSSIDAMLAAALKKKCKEDRPITQLLRRLRAEYQSGLSPAQSAVLARIGGS
jgi:hypothetical protein